MDMVYPDGDQEIKQLLNICPDIRGQEDVLEALLQDRAAVRAHAKPAIQFSFWTRMKARLRSMAMLAMVLLTFPISLALVALSIAREWAALIADGKAAEVSRRLRAGLPGAERHVLGTALVSGAKSTKGLHVCRHLHRAGWRVVLVDVHKNWAAGARWSSCVAAFRTTPIPNLDPVGYIKAVTEIAAKEGAKLFVPVSIAQYSVYEALVARRLAHVVGCGSCTLDAQSTALLNDKIKFTRLCERLRLPAPKMFPITSASQLFELNSRPEVFAGKRFLLKSVHYAATHRADLFTLPCSKEELSQYVKGLGISESKPWMLQQFLTGAEYSSYSIAHEGRVAMHSDNEACLSCLDYAHVDSREIWEWVRDFCRTTKATGQLCFDFMKDESDGKLYAIECNPRCSSIFLNFYNHQHVAEAFFNPQAVLDSGRAPLKPLKSACTVVWFWNEVGELLLSQLPGCRSLHAARQAISVRLGMLWRSADAVLDPADPLPFLGLHYMQVPIVLLRNMWRGNVWTKMDLCTGKLVELGGD